MSDLKFDYPETALVLSGREYGRDWFPDNLAEAIAWLQATLDEVPEAYRAAAVIDVTSEQDYDVPYATIEIKYPRPPTADEIRARKVAAIEAEERGAANLKLNYERAQYRADAIRKGLS